MLLMMFLPFVTVHVTLFFSHDLKYYRVYNVSILYGVFSFLFFWREKQKRSERDGSELSLFGFQRYFPPSLLLHLLSSPFPRIFDLAILKWTVGIIFSFVFFYFSCFSWMRKYHNGFG